MAGGTVGQTPTTLAGRDEPRATLVLFQAGPGMTCFDGCEALEIVVH